MTGGESTTVNGAAAEASPPAEEVQKTTESESETETPRPEPQKPEVDETETLQPSFKETVRKEVLEVLNYLNIVKDHGKLKQNSSSDNGLHEVLPFVRNMYSNPILRNIFHRMTHYYKDFHNLIKKISHM